MTSRSLTNNWKLSTVYIDKMFWKSTINEWGKLNSVVSSPLVFSTGGGLGPVSSLVYKRIASLQSEKHQRPYSLLVNFIRCKFAFSILRSTIRCLRGNRSRPPSQLITVKTKVWYLWRCSEGHYKNGVPSPQGVESGVMFTYFWSDFTPSPQISLLRFYSEQWPSY